MKKLRTGVFAMVAMAMVVAACRPQVPRQYLQPSEMEDVLYDYYLAQAMAAQGNTRDTVAYNKNAYYHAVLAKHGISEAEFDSSLVYYYGDTRRLYDIYQSLSERIGNVAMGLGESVGEIGRYSGLTADGDTANIWRYATSALLMPAPPCNKMAFSIEADSTFQRGDSFQLLFMTDYVYQSGTRDAVVCLAVRHADGHVNSAIGRVPATGVTRLRCEASADSDIASISGFVYMGRGGDDSQTLKLMFVSQLQLIRFHKPQQSLPAQAADSAAQMSPQSAQGGWDVVDGPRPRPHMVRQPVQRVEK